MAARARRRPKKIAKRRAFAASPFANIEWVIEDGGSMLLFAAAMLAKVLTSK
jgi:hypothetical protein